METCHISGGFKPSPKLRYTKDIKMVCPAHEPNILFMGYLLKLDKLIKLQFRKLGLYDKVREINELVFMS